MPKPLKPLLIVFSILIFAGIFALSWNQLLRPAADSVTNGDTSGSGQASQSAETGSGQAATADSGTAGGTPDQSAESAATDQSGTAESQTASSATGEQPAVAAAEGGANDAAAKGDKVAALTPDAGTGSAQSAVPDAETSAAPTVPDAPDSPGAAAQPSFDIVRVEPSGDSVIAGRPCPMLWLSFCPTAALSP